MPNLSLNRTSNGKAASHHAIPFQLSTERRQPTPEERALARCLVAREAAPFPLVARRTHVFPQARLFVLRQERRRSVQLVAGPRVYICDSCVAIASRIMNDPNDAAHMRTPVARTFWQRLFDRLPNKSRVTLGAS